MRIDPKTIKNILVVRNDRFGEFLLNIPALRALKETFVNARVIMVVNPAVKELTKAIPFIDEIIEWENVKHSLLERLQFVNLLKRKNINMAIILNPCKEFNIFTYLSGIPVRVGYARKWDFLLTHRMEDKKYLGEKHEVEYNLELVNLIGAKAEDKTLSLAINGIDDSLLNDFNIKYDSNLIALHPWTSDPIKQWPIDNFCELAKRLVKELDVKIIIIGGKEEQSKAIGLDSNLGDRMTNLTGKTTLIQLALLLKKCKLLISGDSGPVHLASSVGTRVVAIFRNDIPAKTARRWGPWGNGHWVIEKRSLLDINVDEVLNKAKEIIEK